MSRRIPRWSARPWRSSRHLGEGEVQVQTIIRERFRRFTPSPDWTLYAGDTLLIEGEPATLEQVVAQGKLRLGGVDEEPTEADKSSDDFGVMEAVVTADSSLVGRTPVQAALAERYQIAVLAVSRSGERLTRRLRTVRFQPGDVIVLQGNLTQMPEALGELRVLPLAGRDIRLGSDRRRYVPILVLVVAMVLVALQIVPVAFGFFGAALTLMLVRSLSLREAYEAVEWPLLILIGALIPVSAAMQSTGATDIIAAWLSSVAATLPAHGALALIIVAAMAVTPFLNNAATVLVMAPITAQFATQLGFSPDPFLMAVALGAASDFLTPDRPPVEYAGDGTGRLPLRRLLAAGPAALHHRRDRRHSAGAARLAVQRLSAANACISRRPAMRCARPSSRPSARRSSLAANSRRPSPPRRKRRGFSCCRPEKRAPGREVGDFMRCERRRANKVAKDHRQDDPLPRAA